LDSGIYAHSFASCFAARLRRHFIHIDNSHEYCRLAQQRIKTETGTRPKIVKF
jgi:DNA modification methylase